ncbi:hypothetical protein RSO68_11675 [Halomonas saccharevitans]|uniref:Uncharacterized protein n=1 Tax=Halomonas saccharevitans TaxID=416872 RepID=A0ABU3NG47_9GAMM|nr:hypothetical protein [Halomonas saccharevitans]MDT8880137.1 hypothetical protein [Halomonas saccharevitans]
MTELRYLTTWWFEAPLDRVYRTLAELMFAWNHHAVMRDGAEGLARWLDVPLLAIDRQ